MSPEVFAALPEEVAVRELRRRVEAPGFRVSAVTLATTLLEAAAYPAAALGELYFRRWQVEGNPKHIKIAIKIDVPHCKTVEGVLKELAMFTRVYNLVRAVMVQSARVREVAPERIGLIDAVRWLIGVEGSGEESSVLLVNPSRPGRVEPRVAKRRPKQHTRMTKPRSVPRKTLPTKGY